MSITSLPVFSGGLQDTEGDVDLGTMPAECMPVPEQLRTQRPWTQQPSEPQLPQTQQPFPASPGFEMVGPPFVKLAQFPMLTTFT